MSASAEPRLRGHHLVCLQFFRGEGYSAPFVENLTEVVERAADSAALVVEGPDDVCSACPGLSADGTCVDPDAGEVEVRRIDGLAWEILGVRPGERLSLAEARARLSADTVAVGAWRFEACRGCAWEGVCQQGWEALLTDSK